MGWNRTASLHGRLEGGTEMFSPSAVSTPSVDPVHSCHKSGCLVLSQSITAENTPITFKRASLAMPRRWAVLHGSQADESESLPRRRGRFFMEVKRMKVKVCLVGEAAVGKTSLIRRFVLENFDDKYIQTLGTKVSKKELTSTSPDGSGELKIDMTIWDIMGQKGFRELLKEAYFYGARGILAVCDVTRRKTLEDLDDWIEGVYSVTGKIPIEFLGNKIDLKDQVQIS